ncbi:MAG: aspartate aminotransferase family protein [Alphaproteobacteria bacterium]|nr:MAG: aspartate aminotransferase family protein [Alphaproteobacteria bacterium]
MAGHIFGRVCGAELPVAVAGEGCWIIDAEGRRYLDGSGGAAVSSLGHSCERVREAIRRQLDAIAFAHTGFFTSEPAERLADMLVARAPEGIERVWLVSGGSEAVESAIKLARQYFVERGEPGRFRLIARRQSYHGNTLGALAAGGNMWRRAAFDPLLIETHHIAPCYPYRERREGESLEAYGRRAADELEAAIERLGPETVMAFIAEPVVGATAGALVPAPGYFRRIREICDRHGILLILDEVMCGAGRTGTFFACEQEGVRPDILTMAKGLGAGYQPIGAMLCSGEIYRTIAEGSGFFQHGHTYMGHPVAAAAACAVIDEIDAADLLPRVRARGAALEARLRAAFGDHPHVGDIRGRGLFQALEFVADRESKRPFPPETRLAARLKARAMAEGLICYPMPGTIDGREGHHVLLAPPFIISEEELDELVARLGRAIEGVLGELRAAA